MSREEFRQALLGEESRGMVRLLRPFLLLASWPYEAVIRLRNHFYSRGIFRTHRIDVPVVCVGNLTAGGTGKTPLVAWLAREMKTRGKAVAVVARGYRGKLRDGELINDEGLLLKREIPGLIVVQDPDRVAAARKAVDEMGADFIILDDGFQHRRIGRDCDLVTLDARSPFSGGRILPAGLLREPASGVARADLVVLTRCGRIFEDDLEKTTGRVQALSPGAPVFHSDHVPSGLGTVGGEKRVDPADLDGKAVFLCSAIADPGSFRRTALELGVRVTGERVFRDHHDFGSGDVARVVQAARDSGAEAVLTTAKDSVKLASFPEAARFLVLKIEIGFRGREAELLEAITSSTLRRPRSERRTSR